MEKKVPRTTINEILPLFTQLSACSTLTSLQKRCVDLLKDRCQCDVRLYHWTIDKEPELVASTSDAATGGGEPMSPSVGNLPRYSIDQMLIKRLTDYQAGVQWQHTGNRSACAVSSRSRFAAVLVFDAMLTSSGKQVCAAFLAVYNNLFNLMQYGQTDNLTGLLNRQAYEEKVAALYHGTRGSRNRRRSSDDVRDREACFAIIDIDHFKAINDRWGHLYGDEVLVYVAHMMRDFFRAEDLVFRYGGEEFVVVLVGANLRHGKRVIERLRRQIAERELPDIGRITISAGITQMDWSVSYRDVAQRADQALYFVKSQGRNAVGCYEDLYAKGEIGASVPAPQIA
jgi:diguanylate cyclase (GGDEF)-like protein